jgi:hypothetical protein
MRRLRLGFGLTRGRAGPAASFTLNFSGTSSDSLGTYAQVGSHASIGYVETPTSGIETVKWSNSSNPVSAATYGTGANPTDFTAGDGGTLWLHVTIGSEVVTRSIPIRRAAGAFAALSNQAFTYLTGNQTYTHAAGTGTSIVWTYAQVGSVASVTYNAGTRTFTFDTNTLTVQVGTPVVVLATDQYGRTIERSFTFDIALASLAVNTVAPVIAGGTAWQDVISKSSNGTWTAVGGTFSQQWERNTVGTGEFGDTRSPNGVTDSGTSIRLAVTYTNAAGSATAYSNSISVQTFSAPVITGVPTLSDTTPEVGVNVTATPASVTGNPTPLRTWQWLDSTAEINLAMANNYTPVAGDEGDTLRVRQRETNALGSADAFSAFSSAVGAAPVSGTITITAAELTDGGNGQRDLLTITRTLTGTIGTLTAYGAAGGGSLSVSAAQLKAGSGGTDVLDHFTWSPGTAGSSVDVAGVAAAADGATRMAVLLSDGTADSNVFYLTVADLDLVAPTVASAVTDSSGLTVTITLSEEVWGATTPSDWTINVNGSPRTVSTATLNGGTNTVSLILSSAVTVGQTVTRTYAGAGISDKDGNPLAAFTDQAVTNNVSAAWSITGGNGLLTVTAQPATPATPTVNGGNGVLTITG